MLQDIAEFPQRGGANGSVRFYPEITHAANAGIRACTKRQGFVSSGAHCSGGRSNMDMGNSRLALAAGLPVAVKLLKKVADKYDGVSYADLFQMASAQAVEVGVSVYNILRSTRSCVHHSAAFGLTHKDVYAHGTTGHFVPGALCT